MNILLILLSITSALADINPLTDTSQIRDFCTEVDSVQSNVNNYNKYILPNLDKYPDPVERAHFIYRYIRNAPKYPYDMIMNAMEPVRYAAFVALQEKSKFNPRLEAVKEKLKYEPTEEDWNKLEPLIVKLRKLIENTTSPHQEFQYLQNPILLEALKYQCNRYSITHWKSCRNEIETIISQSKPAGVLIQWNLCEEMAFGKKYLKPLNLAALKVIERYESGDHGESSLITDLYDAAIASGFTKADAMAFSFKTLGMLAVSGSETPWDIGTMLTGNLLNSGYGNVYDYPAFQALNVLATLPLVLDIRANEQKKNFYSYPPFIKNTCQVGKSYHFWLSAYLAWNGAHKTSNEFDRKGVADAVWITEQMYQMMATGPGRGIAFRANYERVYDPYSRVVRRDFVYSQAAIRFGKMAATRKSFNWADYKEINMDDIQLRLYANATHLEPLDKSYNLRGLKGQELIERIIVLQKHFNKIIAQDTIHE